MTFALGFIVGLFIGGIVAFCAFAVVTMAHESDRRMGVDE